MPTTGANLEPLLNMLTALAQRQQTVHQLVAQLQAGTVWRSPDGQLAAVLSAAQRTELEAFVKAYLDESDVLIAAARTMVGQPPPQAGPATPEGGQL